MDLVTIVVPCYRQAAFLPEALDSVLAQSYSNWECIIVNDGSPDNTEEVALKYCYTDPRFKYLKKENGGLSSARNAGIKNSLGKFILPLDADDLIQEEYLEKAVKVLEKNEDVKIVYCNAEYFGGKKGKWELKPFSIENIAKSNVIFCSSFFRRRDYERTGGYSTDMIYGFEDWDFWISIIKTGGKVVKLEDTCFYYRVKEESMVSGMDLEKQQFSRLKVIEHHLDFYTKNFGDPITWLWQIDRIEKKIQILRDTKTYKLLATLKKGSNFFHRLKKY